MMKSVGLIAASLLVFSQTALIASTNPGSAPADNQGVPSQARLKAATPALAANYRKLPLGIEASQAQLGNHTAAAPPKVWADTTDSSSTSVPFSEAIISGYAGNGYNAGTGLGGYSGDGGPATSAELSGPTGIAFDANEDLYIADTANQVVRRVDGTTGIITTFAGGGIIDQTCSYTPGPLCGEGGPAGSAYIPSPFAVVCDATGNLYIADTILDVVLRVDLKTDIISTIAGTGSSGYSGDGGPATSAQLHGPRGLALDEGGNLYIADTFNSAIREVSAGTGVITTVPVAAAEVFPPSLFHLGSA